jgi:hypothetical protein
MDFYSEMPMPAVYERVGTLTKAVEGLSHGLTKDELYAVARNIALETPDYSRTGYYESGSDMKELEKFKKILGV